VTLPSLKVTAGELSVGQYEVRVYKVVVEVEKMPGGPSKLSLKAKSIGEIPRDTFAIEQELLPEGNIYRVIGEQYAEIEPVINFKRVPPQRSLTSE
jgi:hypothetical protein